jgi:hypothetical protein
MAFACRNWGRNERGISVRAVSLQAEIGTQDLPNTKQGCYPFNYNIWHFTTQTLTFHQHETFNVILGLGPDGHQDEYAARHLYMHTFIPYIWLLLIKETPLYLRFTAVGGICGRQKSTIQGFLKVFHQSNSCKATGIFLLKPPIQNNNDGIKMNYYSSFPSSLISNTFMLWFYLSKNNIAGYTAIPWWIQDFISEARKYKNSRSIINWTKYIEQHHNYAPMNYYNLGINILRRMHL